MLRPVAVHGPAGGGFAAPLDAFALPVFALAAAIASALLVELVFDVVRLRRIKRAALPLGAVAVRGAQIGTSRTVATPTAIGYLHPAVVVPAGFRARVDAGEWDAVIAHECAHLARRDDWAKALQSAALRACWWLPGLWLLGRALDLERELASDEHAAWATGPRRYAACLLRLATNRGGDELAPALWGRRSHVAIRVERLLRPVGPAAPVVRATALGAFTAAALAVLALAVMAVPSTIRPYGMIAAKPLGLGVAAHRRHGGPAPRAAAANAPVRAVRRAAERPSSAVVRPAAVVAEAIGAQPAVHRAAPSASASLEVRAPGVRIRPRAAVVAAAPPATARVPLTGRAAPELRRAPPIRATAPASPTALAYSAPRVRCATCFGPLRSPDGSYAPAAGATAASATPAFSGGTPPIATITTVPSDDPSGPTELRPGMLWVRMPRVSGP
ncbi:MAG: hypothetical protein NVS3B10_04290 [Polyangiales bacterium]